MSEEYKFFKSSTPIPREAALDIEKAFVEKFGVAEIESKDVVGTAVFGGFVEGYLASHPDVNQELVEALERILECSSDIGSREVAKQALTKHKKD